MSSGVKIDWPIAMPQKSGSEPESARVKPPAPCSQSGTRSAWRDVSELDAGRVVAVSAGGEAVVLHREREHALVVGCVLRCSCANAAPGVIAASDRRAASQRFRR